ncbi:MAG TPA: hypothetical protein VFV02_02470, partial [Acidimicrobiales bacterium]|nr:hypothetical protein [Acidimicrobiales bacterium]
RPTAEAFAFWHSHARLVTDHMQVDGSLDEFHVSGQGEDGGVRLRGARIEGAVSPGESEDGAVRLRSADIGGDLYGSGTRLTNEARQPDAPGMVATSRYG